MKTHFGISMILHVILGTWLFSSIEMISYSKEIVYAENTDWMINHGLSENVQQHVVIDEPNKENEIDPYKHEEKQLLAKLVHAEAQGEPYEGKVAVAEVVLNRLDSPHYPDSIQHVIYQEGQFSPVQDGRINTTYTEDDMEAVMDAITEGDSVPEALYFYNPVTSTSNWVATRPVVGKIGNHVFAQ